MISGQSLTCPKGASLTFEIDMDTGSDLTGATAQWALCESWFDQAKVYLTKTGGGDGLFIGQDAGVWKITVNLAPTDTLDIPSGLLYHDCKVLLQSGDVEDVANGPFSLDPSANILLTNAPITRNLHALQTLGRLGQNATLTVSQLVRNLLATQNLGALVQSGTIADRVSATATQALAGIGQVATADGGNTQLLDAVAATASSAFSTRKLRAAYAGACLKIRRSSDNTTLDIGFDGSGNLDTAAMAAFVGANDGFISVWYDQSINALNMTQATAAAQPKLVNAGTNNTINGKAAPIFNAGANQVMDSTLVQNVASRHFNSVAAVTDLGSVRPFFGASSDGIEIRINTGGAIELIHQGIAIIGTSTGLTLGVNVQHILEAVYTQASGAWAMWVDGTPVGTGTNAQTIGVGQLQVGGASLVGEFFHGYIAETVTFDSVLSSGDRSALEANQEAYWAT